MLAQRALGRVDEEHELRCPLRRPGQKPAPVQVRRQPQARHRRGSSLHLSIQGTFTHGIQYFFIRNFVIFCFAFFWSGKKNAIV